MKKQTALISLSLIILLTSPVVTAADNQTPNTSSATNSTQKSKKTTGYELADGTTSASQLRAKRSHAASKQNENKITIFLGLIILAVITFFLEPFKNK